MRLDVCCAHWEGCAGQMNRHVLFPPQASGLQHGSCMTLRRTHCPKYEPAWLLQVCGCKGPQPSSCMETQFRECTVFQQVGMYRPPANQRVTHFDHVAPLPCSTPPAACFVFSAGLGTSLGILPAPAARDEQVPHRYHRGTTQTCGPTIYLQSVHLCTSVRSRRAQSGLGR